jgi:hypothetical protein
MSKSAKLTAFGEGLRSKAADQDVLNFLSRTLQAHILDAEPQDVLVKLQNLKRALDQQEITLAKWPDSSSKDRICAALAKAKTVVARIVDQYDATVGKSSALRDAKVM